MVVMEVEKGELAVIANVFALRIMAKGRARVLHVPVGRRAWACWTRGHQLHSSLARTAGCGEDGWEEGDAF